MTYRIVVRGLVVLLCLCVGSDVLAARRGIRIDFGGGWQAFPGADIGSPDCPGSAGGSTLIERYGLTFSGFDDDAFLFDTYCQRTVPGEFNENSFSPEEAGLAELVGPNAGDAVTAIRFAFADADRFENGPAFQWAFYDFPNGVTIVALYGLLNQDLSEIPITDATSYIRDGGTTLWGGDEGHDDEYFCLVDGVYVGTWSGDPQEPGSACLVPFQRVFGDGFE